jgi:hypothetical protein
MSNWGCGSLLGFLVFFGIVGLAFGVTPTEENEEFAEVCMLN